MAMLRAKVLSEQVAPQDEEKSQAMVLSREVTASAALPLGRHPNFPGATTAALFPAACHDALNLDNLLSPEERGVRDRVRAFMEKEVAPVIAPFWERAEFPFKLVPGLSALNVGGGMCRGYGLPNLSIMANAMVICEMARVDASFNTFLLVHSHLCMLTISLLGSEEQKQELLPRLSKFELVGCWGLTEPSNGSDAAALTTTATKVPGGWQLDGFKRWIGNGTFADVVCVWARSSETQEVNCFIVRKGTKGYTSTKIENKISLRCTQNADMTFDRCFVPDSARLPGVNSFKDTNKVLAISRVMVAWQPVGIVMGVFDVCARYVKERSQFGTHIGAFQLVQEKLARMLGSIQAMWLTTWRVSKLHEEGRMSHEQASLVKAFTTLRGREVVALGREILGGNGIQTDFHVAKAFCDIEAIYSYEGTYEVNVLVTGRGITGMSAIKARAPTAK